MDDLISRAAEIDNLMTNMGWRDEAGYKVITDLFNGIPAVDAAPVAHGRWTYFNCVGKGRYQCSECLHWVDAGTDRNYCPNCGAKMDGDVNE